MIVDSYKFNAWRNGQDFTETCRVLNEREIDYNGWTDMDMYLWYVANISE